MYQLTGTDGFANKYPVEQYCLRPGENEPKNMDLENLNAHKAVSADVKKQLMEEYKHRIHREIEAKAREIGGHGGMDFRLIWMYMTLRSGAAFQNFQAFRLTTAICLLQFRTSQEDTGMMSRVTDMHS